MYSSHSPWPALISPTCITGVTTHNLSCLMKIDLFKKLKSSLIEENNHINNTFPYYKYRYWELVGIFYQLRGKNLAGYMHAFLRCHCVIMDVLTAKESLIHKGSPGWIPATLQCDPSNNYYPIGIYGDVVMVSMTSALFFNKYFYCLWLGLKNLR